MHLPSKRVPCYFSVVSVPPDCEFLEGSHQWYLFVSLPSALPPTSLITHLSTYPPIVPPSIHHPPTCPPIYPVTHSFLFFFRFSVTPPLPLAPHTGQRCFWGVWGTAESCVWSEVTEEYVRRR